MRLTDPQVEFYLPATLSGGILFVEIPTAIRGTLNKPERFLAADPKAIGWGSEANVTPKGRFWYYKVKKRFSDTGSYTRFLFKLLTRPLSTLFSLGYVSCFRPRAARSID